MDSGKRSVESESESKRLKEGDDQKIGKISEFSYGLIDRLKTMEEKYLKAEEKCRLLEAEKRKPEMDMELVAHSSVDALEKLQAAGSEIDTLKNYTVGQGKDEVLRGTSVLGPSNGRSCEQVYRGQGKRGSANLRSIEGVGRQ